MSIPAPTDVTIAITHNNGRLATKDYGFREQPPSCDEKKARSVLVVGDGFLDFCASTSAITLSQLGALLKLPADLVLCERMLLIPGQGLSDDDIDAVLTQAEVSPQRDRLDFHFWQLTPRRAGRELSHKHRVENTLISAPRQVDDDVFELDLLVDDDCELMRDHQTGQHLQGMLLVEAARQAFLAITEGFLLPRDGTEFYFVFNSLSAQYKRFLFPLAARLRCRVHEREVTATNRRFLMEAAIEQVGSETATISCGFVVVKKRSMAKMERSLAKEAAANHLAEVAAGWPSPHLPRAGAVAAD